MAFHQQVDAIEDAQPHHEHKPVKIDVDKTDSHDVMQLDKFLHEVEGQHGASVTQPLHELANKSHDTDGHFTTAPKDMRSHIDKGKEK